MSQGGRSAEEMERDRKMQSSGARAIQSTAISGSRTRTDQMAMQGGQGSAAEYNS